jgi:hypothetical protein
MAAELVTRYFHSDITEALRLDNSFMQFAKNDDAFVNNNSVELPHAGTDPVIAIDRAVFPGTITQRTDAATQYILEELSTDPTHLQFSEELIVNYAKRQSITNQHSEVLIDTKGTRCIYGWALGVVGAGTYIETTGTATRASDAPGSTLTTIKELLDADVLALKLLMDKDNVPSENRKLLLPPGMANDLLKEDKFTRMDAYGMSNIPDGWVGRIYGFDVMMRTHVTAHTTSTLAIKDPAAATAITDQAGAIAWHPSFVRRANGSIKTFLNVDVAEYYGSIFSAAVRFGALAARNDNKGVYQIIEGV